MGSCFMALTDARYKHMHIYTYYACHYIRVCLVMRTGIERALISCDEGHTAKVSLCGGRGWSDRAGHEEGRKDRGRIGRPIAPCSGGQDWKIHV